MKVNPSLAISIDVESPLNRWIELIDRWNYSHSSQCLLLSLSGPINKTLLTKQSDWPHVCVVVKSLPVMLHISFPSPSVALNL